jgi:hypothetical protein
MIIGSVPAFSRRCTISFPVSRSSEVVGRSACLRRVVIACGLPTSLALVWVHSHIFVYAWTVFNERYLIGLIWLEAAQALPGNFSHESCGMRLTPHTHSDTLTCAFEPAASAVSTTPTAHSNHAEPQPLAAPSWICCLFAHGGHQTASVSRMRREARASGPTIALAERPLKGAPHDDVTGPRSP